jgi:hypothetical protein
MAAPELAGTTSMQVCGTEWVSHVTCRRKLMDELLPVGAGGAGGSGAGGAGELGPGGTGGPGTQSAPNGRGEPGEQGGSNGGGEAPMHPTRDIFNGMVSRQKRALASSEGALLIDELLEWLGARIDESPERQAVRHGHHAPERIGAQIALGYFLSFPVAPPIDFDPDALLRDGESLGWDLVRARARHSDLASSGGRPSEDPDYRFAVVQSELYRRYLRLAVQRFDVGPLALYLKHLALWYEERPRSEPVERVVQTLLDRSARGLGLEATR